MDHVRDVNEEAPCAIRLDTQVNTPRPTMDVERVGVQARLCRRERRRTENLANGLEHVGQRVWMVIFISLLRVRGPGGSSVTPLSSLNLPGSTLTSRRALLPGARYDAGRSPLGGFFDLIRRAAVGTIHEDRAS